MDRGALSPKIEALAREIVDSAFHVHRELGPGLLESVCEMCLAYELQKRDLNFRRQVKVPIQYDGNELDADFRLDLLVNEEIILEIKAVDRLMPVHDAQLLTYLKLSGKRLGFLINFNVPVIKQGIRRKIL